MQRIDSLPSTKELQERKEADLAISERLADEFDPDGLPKEEFVTDKNGKRRSVPLIYNTKVKSTAAPMKKYKTKMCPELPHCSRGAHCKYAHDERELVMYTKLNDECLTPYYRKAKHMDHAELCHNQQCPVRLRLLLRKTVICKYWKEGDCHKGTKCRHAHGNRELQPLPKYEVCKKYQRKECSLKNDECVYAHGRHELRDRPAHKKDVSANIHAAAGAAQGCIEKESSEDEPNRLCSLCSDLFQKIPEEIRSRYIIFAIDMQGLPDSKSLTKWHGQVIQMNPPASFALKPSGESIGRESILRSANVNQNTGDFNPASELKNTEVEHHFSGGVPEFLPSNPKKSAEMKNSMKRTGCEKQQTQSEYGLPQHNSPCIKQEIETINSFAPLATSSDEDSSDSSSFQTDESDRSESEEEDDSDEVDEQIERVLDTNQVKRYQILHVPNKCKEIEISGSGITALEKELVKIAEDCGYRVVVKDLAFPETSQAGPVTSNWITLCSGNFALASTEDENSHISTIEVVVQAEDKRRQRQQTDYFGVTTAHSFLSQEDNDMLMASSEKFLEVVNRLAAKHMQLNYYMNVPKKLAIDFSGNPLPLYRYWMRKGASGDWSALQDVALVRLDREQVRSDGLLRGANLDVNKHHHVLLSGDIHLHQARCEEDVKKLRKQKIICCQKSGTLTKPPKIKDNEHVLGVHLAFTLDDGECLQPGDCGSAVYLADKRSLPMIGLFFGNVKEQPYIHQAVILDWNLMLVENVPELKIGKIKLADDEDKGDGIE